jgi:hypothetical protein
MSNMPREDMPCPYCQVFPPFTIMATGIMITRDHYGMSAAAGAVTRTVCRRPWELALLEHIQTRHRDRFRELMAEQAVSSPAES